MVYPELSYTIVGLAYQVFNEIGYGMREKYYQDAYAKALQKQGIVFARERCVSFYYQGKPLSRCFLDFVIDDKIVVELKVRARFGYVDIRQVMSYLKVIKYKLAILLYFTREGVKFRRVLNAN